MHVTLDRDIQEEAELIARFVRSYRRRFAVAIDSLNRQTAADAGSPEFQCLRLCVETMDMVLVHQDRLARALRRMTDTGPTLKAA